LQNIISTNTNQSQTKLVWDIFEKIDKKGMQKLCEKLLKLVEMTYDDRCI